jgi:butyryl-CoA dehydrogenase
MKTDGAMQSEVGQTAAKFAARHIKPVAAETDHGGTRFPSEIFALGAEAGFDRFAIAEEIGGYGFGMAELCALIETLARTCAGHAMVFGVHAAALKAVVEACGENAGGIPTMLFDSRQPVGVALPEPLDAGSMDIGLSVVYENEKNICVAGAAGLAVNARESGFIICFARRTDGSAVALLTESNNDSCRLGSPEPALGLRAMPMAELNFSRHFVGKEFIVAEGGKAVDLYDALLMNLCLVSAAASVGTMTEAYGRALAYAVERYQGGMMIIDHSHVRTILGGMSASVESSKGSLYHAASRQSDSAAVVGMKKTVTENAVRVCTDAVQVHGGYGYMRDYGIEKAMRDTAVLSLFPITNERCGLLLAAIGKAGLT